jgi:hypothetical protein
MMLLLLLLLSELRSCIPFVVAVVVVRGDPQFHPSCFQSLEVASCLLLLLSELKSCIAFVVAVVVVVRG